MPHAGQTARHSHVTAPMAGWRPVLRLQEWLPWISPAPSAMSTLGMIFISASVGARGRNAPDDVRTIQSQLNALMPPGRTRLMVDGRCGPLTIDAIRTFQKVVCGMQWPDGLVDPDKRTIAAMSDPTSARTWAGLGPAVASAETPAAVGGGREGTPATEPPSRARVDAVKAAIDAAKATIASPQIPINKAPEKDGEINCYESDDYPGKPYFNRMYSAIFVNGMITDGGTHKSHASLLSSTLRCPVYGVYNATRNVGVDLLQCVTDKLGLHGAVGEFVGADHLLRALLQAQHAAYRQAGLDVTWPMFMEGVISDNLATLRLFRALRAGPLSNRRIPLYAHSQGNLIVSNALRAVALTDGDAAIAGRVVESYGSPCRYWPRGISRRDHRISLDPITLAQLRRSHDMPAVHMALGDLYRLTDTHGFDVYMMHDPEFIIASCRWTKFGFRHTLDADDLVQRLIELGGNTRRIAGVFDRLASQYTRLADTVALRYCTRMFSHAQSSLQRMLREEPEGRKLIDNLERCLRAGLWVSDDEKQMVHRLWTLRL
jgi:peptidoglycan hydrolase-like protein with peptidoglycan-binding domain